MDQFFKFEVSTERLDLKIAEERDTQKVLDFLQKGAPYFEEYESEKVSDFYTYGVQKRIINGEYDLATNRIAVRYYVYLKGQPNEIIGTVSYSYHRGAPFNSAFLGYKFLKEYWHQGYAQEAIGETLCIVRQVLNLQRIEAFVLPENRPSQTLLSRLGFRLEGTAYSCIEVQGVRRDHLQYSFIYPELY